MSNNERCWARLQNVSFAHGRAKQTRDQKQYSNLAGGVGHGFGWVTVMEGVI